MNDFCILSIAFGDRRYKDQLYNLQASIERHHPLVPFHYWLDEMPPGAKKQNDSMYGFKVWAVNYARDHEYKKIIWLDPACILVDKLDPYFQLVKEYGVVAAKDDNLLANYCSDTAFDYFGITREKSREEKQHLVGGSIYVFDFDLPLCNTIFDRWKQAEIDGVFGSQFDAASEKLQSHRNDESVMALSLYTAGSTPVPYDLCRYNDVRNPLLIKKHFK